mmetsp:Transcript_3495/g.9831  ORF Transcript_3495/g.9831 Transcript_3495/m.9831 type:complete len:395 (-) Transcript_3495:473-1657(-)
MCVCFRLSKMEVYLYCTTKQEGTKASKACALLSALHESGEPGDRVVPRSLEGASPVHRPVVVKQNHVALLHVNEFHHFHDGPVDLEELLVGERLVVAERAVRLVRLARAGGLLQGSQLLLTVVAQKLGVRVQVAEDDGQVAHGVPDHGRLGRGVALERHVPVVALLHEAKEDVEIHLETDRKAHQALDQRLGDVLPDPLVEVLQESHGELHHAEDDLLPLHLLQQRRGELVEEVVAADGPELPALVGGLEANKPRVPRGLRPDHLVVHANDVVRPAWLVHRLVDLVLRAAHRTSRHRVDRVQAWVEPQNIVKVMVPRSILHQLVPREVNRSILLQKLHNLFTLGAQVIPLRLQVTEHDALRGLHPREPVRTRTRPRLQLSNLTGQDVLSPNNLR